MTHPLEILVVSEHVVQVGRSLKEDAWIDALFLEDLCRGAAALGVVGAGEVPPVLVGRDLLEEVPARAERLEVEQFVLDRGVRALDVSVGVGRAGRQEAVRRVEAFDQSVIADRALAFLAPAVFSEPLTLSGEKRWYSFIVW